MLFAWIPSALVSSESRQLNLKVLADENFRRLPNWQQKIEAAVSSASREFEMLSGIAFFVRKFEDWVPDHSLATLDLLTNDLDSRVDREDCDIILAITARPDLKDRFYGNALFQEAIVVLKDSPEPSLLARCLKHELAHLFGAVHVDDPDSVMDIFSRGGSFDMPNIQIIRLNRGRTFNTVDFPTPQELRSQAIKIYQAIKSSINSSKARAASGHTERIKYEGRQKIVYLEAPPGKEYGRMTADVNILLAQVQLENKDYTAALAECQRALQLVPGDLEVKNLLGIIHRRKGDLDKAIQVYSGILKTEPRRARIFYNLGIAYSKKGDIPAASAAYEKAISLKPNLAEAHLNLGDIYLRQDLIEQAQREFLRALTLAPRYSQAGANLAEAYLRKGDLERAHQQIEETLALDPALASAHTVKGNILHKEGALDLAMQEYREAISREPNDDKVLFNLGNCFLDKNDPGEAQKSFARAVALNPGFAEARASLGYCRLLDGKVDEAVEEIQKALELGFQSAKAYLNLSSAYLLKGLPDSALRAARKSTELDPSLSLAFNNAGIALTNKKQFPEAIVEFKRSLALDPKARRRTSTWATSNSRLEIMRRHWQFILMVLELTPAGPLFTTTWP